MDNETDIEYNSMPTSKDSLMARIDREWAALESVIAGLPDERMVVPDTGGWSIKDNLAHLSTWEKILREVYLGKTPAAKAFNMSEDFLRYADVDQSNAVLYARDKDRSLPDVLAGMRATHAELLAVLEAMPFEAMLQLSTPDDPEQRLVLEEIVGNTYDHYREHRATIEKFVNKG